LQFVSVLSRFDAYSRSAILQPDPLCACLQDLSGLDPEQVKQEAEQRQRAALQVRNYVAAAAQQLQDLQGCSILWVQASQHAPTQVVFCFFKLGLPSVHALMRVLKAHFAANAGSIATKLHL
jgi:hypothetical protein